jgi:NAD(P)-dependent dehydrogenase (short-subunit alcohol dehydrogenase family)
MHTVLITGANRGIGLALARHYAAAGAKVVATARHPEAAPDLLALHHRYPETVLLEQLDITLADQLAGMKARLGALPIDILINNAGILGPRGAEREHLHQQFFGTLNYDAWTSVIETNVYGPLRVCEALVENVAHARLRKIVFLSSTAGSIQEGLPPTFLYAGSKAMLNKSVKLLAGVLKPRGIAVAALCPGHVKTELGGKDAFVEPEESAAGLAREIQALTLEGTGAYRRFNGETIAW